MASGFEGQAMATGKVQPFGASRANMPFLNSLPNIDGGSEDGGELESPNLKINNQSTLSINQLDGLGSSKVKYFYRCSEILLKLR